MGLSLIDNRCAQHRIHVKKCTASQAMVASKPTCASRAAEEQQVAKVISPGHLLTYMIFLSQTVSKRWHAQTRHTRDAARVDAAMAIVGNLLLRDPADWPVSRRH
jgi:hypothetical protein